MSSTSDFYVTVCPTTPPCFPSLWECQMAMPSNNAAVVPCLITSDGWHSTVTGEVTDQTSPYQRDLYQWQQRANQAPSQTHPRATLWSRGITNFSQWHQLKQRKRTRNEASNCAQYLQTNNQDCMIYVRRIKPTLESENQCGKHNTSNRLFFQTANFKQKFHSFHKFAFAPSTRSQQVHCWAHL